MRTGSGGFTYTKQGPADVGFFDLTSRTVTVNADVSKLNALQTHGAIGARTMLLGLRGSASIERYTAAGAVGVGMADSTRAGTPFGLSGTCF